MNYNYPFRRYKKKTLLLLETILHFQIDDFEKIKHKKLLQARVIIAMRNHVDQKKLKGSENTILCYEKLSETKIAVGCQDAIIIWDNYR